VEAEDVVNDRETLAKLLVHEELKDEEREAFADMLEGLNGKWRQLTEKQRAWASRRLDELEVRYENLVSSGKAPRGREVEMMFKPGPLKPPGRP
jgi:hypothetical protein